MRHQARKFALIAALLLAVPLVPALSGSGADAKAGTIISGQITIGTPVAVLGFSFGNPYVVGHVHTGLQPCALGPLYWYPEYQVYGHLVPRYRTVVYPTPVTYRYVAPVRRPGPPYGRAVGYWRRVGGYPGTYAAPPARGYGYHYDDRGRGRDDEGWRGRSDDRHGWRHDD